MQAFLDRDNFVVLSHARRSLYYFLQKEKLIVWHCGH